MFLRSLATAACCTLLATASLAQMGDMKMDKPAGQSMPSPPATADRSPSTASPSPSTTTPPASKAATIGSDIVPYGEVWRTGANPATTLITATNLKIGTLDVPAGTYTLFTLPSAKQWLLIVSKKTGEWGIAYPEGNDLGRTPMTSKPLSASQEKMSITFENTNGNSTELHVKWGTTDQYVTVKAQ